MVANSALTDVEELAIMRGYGATTVSLLKPWISALPKATSININTAPEQLLFAMGGESPQVFTDYVLRQRPFYSLDNFHEGLSVALNMEATTSCSVLGQMISWELRQTIFSFN